jgi:hypothetical protein
MTWRVWVVLALVLVLGFARLLIEKRPDKPINAAAAKQIAESCLGPAKSVATNTGVTLLPFPKQQNAADQKDQQKGSDQKPSEAELEFRALAAMQIDIGASGAAPGKLLTVKKEQGDFDFELSGGPAILKTGDDQFYIDTSRKPRFGAAAKTSYRITLPDSVNLATKTEAGRTFVLVPVGTTGIIKLASELELVALQPISTRPWLNDVRATLLPVRAIGQQGLSDLSIDVKQGGVRFDEQGFALDGCAWRSSDDPSKGIAVGVTEIKAAGTGAAVARLAIPSNLIPAWPDDLRRPIAQIELVLASADGRYKAYGGFTAVPKLFAAALALGIIGLALYWLVNLRATELKTSMNRTAAVLKSQGRKQDADRAKETGEKAWFASLFLGNDHQPSLSLFQIFFWTLITVWGITYVYLTTGSLLAMTASMMALLGIAGVGSVIARWISPDPKPTSETVDPKIPSKPFEFWQILSTDGNFDLLKLQLLVFTLSIGVYVVWRIADTAAFPELDANTLLLLGVSQGVYIGGKLAGSTALNRAQTLKVDIASKKEARTNLANQITTDQAGVAALPDGAQKTALQASIVANTAKLGDLDKAIATAEADLAKAIKELGLS